MTYRIGLVCGVNMAIIENRTRDKYKGVFFHANFFRYFQRFSALFFIIVSLHLIYFSPYHAIRAGTLESTGSIIYATLPYIHGVVDSIKSIEGYNYNVESLKDENLKLKLEIARLKEIEYKAFTIAKENESLRQYTKTVTSPLYDVITARVTLHSTGLYGHSMMLHAGAKDGVEPGQVVVYHDKLIGRITEVSDHYSKVLLITDTTSKVPVVSSTSRMHGIVSVNHDGECVLLYAPSESKLEPGELLITSGEGKYYPHGLIVATIKKIMNNEVTTIPAIDLRYVDFVGIIKPKD